MGGAPVRGRERTPFQGGSFCPAWSLGGSRGTNTGSEARIPDENETRGQLPRVQSDRKGGKRTEGPKGPAQAVRPWGPGSGVGGVGRAPPGVGREPSRMKCRCKTCS